MSRGSNVGETVGGMRSVSEAKVFAAYSLVSPVGRSEAGMGSGYSSSRCGMEEVGQIGPASAQVKAIKRRRGKTLGKLRLDLPQLGRDRYS